MGISRSGSCAALIIGAVLAISVAGPDEGKSAIRAAASGSIRGRVTVAAAVPATVKKVTVDEKICGMSVPDDAIVADAEGGIAHAVVAVKGLGWSQSAPARLSNKGCRFVPHVAVVAPGATVEVVSEDNTLHTTHAYAADGRSLFNIALPLPGITVKRPVEKKPGLIRLACDTHPWMQGFVYVSADRAVVSEGDGRFVFPDVPPGSYELSVWHERLKADRQRVTVTAGETADLTFVMAPGS
jgi:plastocyanin